MPSSQPTPTAQATVTTKKSKFFGFMQHKDDSLKDKEKDHKSSSLGFLKRSASHHVSQSGTGQRSRANTTSFAPGHSSHPTSPGVSSPIGTKPSTPLPKPNPIKRASTTIKVNSVLSHQKENAFIGTGTDIAAPRNAPPSNPTTHSFYGVNNGASSRNPSVYSIARNMTNGTTISSDDEKKNLLSLPVQDPNSFLGPNEQQAFSTLSDNYIVPEKGSAKDKKLGDGASATVFIVQEKKTSKSFALKKFLLFTGESSESFYARAIKEFRIAKRLSNNKHIVETLYCLKIASSTNINRGWGFVMEYCKGGDLFSLITRSGWKSSPINEKWCLFKQIAIGIKHVQDHGYVHRDLKPENVLIDEYGCCKITDFGVAEFCYDIPEDEFNALESYLNPDHEHLDDDKEAGVQYHNGYPVKLSKSFVGSPPYVPPEVMTCKSGSQPELYNPFRADTWSLGMILFCLVYQNTPFKVASKSDSSYFEYVMAFDAFTRTHPQFRGSDRSHGPGIEYRFGKEFNNTGAARCAWRLCDPNPDTRYTLDDLFSDPWFISVETCQDDWMHSPLHRSDSALSSNGNGNPVFTAKHSSATSSPIIKPKSMLDLNAESINTSSLPSPITEVSENPFLKSDLPTLSEDNEEPTTTTIADVAASMIPIETTPMKSMCDFIPSSVAPAHLASPPAIASPTPSAIAANILHNNQSQSNQSIHSTMAGGGSVAAADDQHNISSVGSITGDLNFMNVNRSSSISSMSSAKSITGNNMRSGSTGSTGKRLKHHHLDIINIQKHVSIKR